MTMNYITSEGIKYDMVNEINEYEQIIRLEHTAHCFKAYEVNPSIGCDFICRYCSMYSQEQNESHTPIRIFNNYPNYLRDFIINYKDKHSLLFYYSAISDAFSPANIESGITKKILEVFRENKSKYFILTKGANIPQEIFDILIETKDRNQIIISFGIPDRNYEKMLEKKAPSSINRLKFAKECIQNGITVTGIVAPYLPIDETQNYAFEVFKKFNDIGIKHLCIQPLKVSDESLNRLCSLLPKYKVRLENIFDKKHKMLKGWKLPCGKYIDRYYTNIEYLTLELQKLKNISVELGMTISTCAEICKLTVPDFNIDAYKVGYNCAGISKKLIKEKEEILP